MAERNVSYKTSQFLGNTWDKVLPFNKVYMIQPSATNDEEMLNTTKVLHTDYEINKIHFLNEIHKKMLLLTKY